MISVDQILQDLASSDASIRHGAALEVIDHDIQDAVPVLIESILNPKNIGYTGTLVYALGHFECAMHFPTLVRISISQSYEAACGAMNIIDDQNLNPTSKQLEEALCIIKEASSRELTDDQSEALRLIKERYYKKYKAAEQAVDGSPH